MSASRFTDNDTWLGDEIAKIRRNYFYVRTKVGADISSDRKAHPRTHDQDAVIGEIRQNVAAHLKARTFDVVVLKTCRSKPLCSCGITRGHSMERIPTPHHIEIWVLSHCAHFTMLRLDSFLYMHYFVYIACMCRTVTW